MGESNLKDIKHIENDCLVHERNIVDVNVEQNGLSEMKYPIETQLSDKHIMEKIGDKQDLGQFQPSKMNSKYKSIFENPACSEEVEIRKQPKRKLITLDQVLIKSSSQDMKHEKEVELEIIKTLRKNWVPPEESNVEVAQTKLEPKKLQIAHVYGNDSRDGPEKFKQQRENELQEVRQSAPLGARWMSEDTADENRTRPRSALKVTQSDDFWLKLKSDEKVEEEKLKVLKEIESIKQARLKFEDEPEERQEDDARLKTLQELESLRYTQKQTDNSVKKIKRDLEEINRNIAEKENKTKPVVDFQTPTEQWRKEREKIQETFSTKVKDEKEMQPAASNPSKLNKIVFKEEFPVTNIKELKIQAPCHISSPDELAVETETDTVKSAENTTIEDKAKLKLKEIKNLEIFKLKEKTLKLTQKIETERGRRRVLKKTESKENTTLRSKSISTLKTAGQKIKSLTNEKLRVVMKSKSGEDHENKENNLD